MATKTPPQPSSSPFSRLSRLGAGLGLKSQPSPMYTNATEKEEEDWYIAYNGPYELPKDTRKRDSWGDLVEEEGRDAILDADLISRYGGGSSGRASGGTDNMGYRRSRVQSSTSRTTTSTATIDPNRRSTRSPQRRSANPNAKRAPVSSYINLDTAGGVGESPMPPYRSSSPISATSPNRTSLANLFSLSATRGEKVVRSPSTVNLAERNSRNPSPAARQSTSVDMTRPKERARVLSAKTVPVVSTDADDYYNSYYSTLLTTPKYNQVFGVNEQRSKTAGAKSSLTLPRSTDRATSPASSPIDSHKPRFPVHPYAYTFPPKIGSTSTTQESPTSAPPVTRSITSPALSARHVPQNSTSSHQHLLRPILPPLHPGARPRKLSHSAQLKSSVSTPNLRSAQKVRSPLSPQVPRGADRWLSAETWCDAMLFPRPRFKVKQGPGSTDTGSEKHSSGRSSGRIVSPPPTPISRSPVANSEKPPIPERKELKGNGALGTGSRLQRKLTKSRSAGNLKSTDNLISSIPLPSDPFARADIARANSKGKGKLQKSRPRDLVLDNLAVRVEPSLDRVLDEGDELEERRRQWQAQATSSLGNKATRSLSRGRAKSLSHKDSRRHRRDMDGGKAMGSIDFLTARTLLGSQGVAPVISVHVPPSSQNTKPDTLTGTMSSHAHTGSLAHSSSQKSSSQGAHRRNNSWGQSALKLAKSTASGALCGIRDQSMASPLNEKAATVEGAILSSGTRVIHFNDQPPFQDDEEFVVIDCNTLSDAAPGTLVPAGNIAAGPSGTNGVSPTPSEATGNGVGIAISTPPPSDDHSRTYESISIPDHPYAQGAMYSYHQGMPDTTSLKGSDYAGPHPSSPKMAAIPIGGVANDMATRHRLPPQATLQSLPRMAHPYAMGSLYPVAQTLSSLADVNEHEPRTGRMAHAYAPASARNSENLDITEALTAWGGEGGRDSEFLGKTNQSLTLDQSTAETEKRRPANRDSNSQTWPPRRKPVSYIGLHDQSGSGDQEANTPFDHLETPAFNHDNSMSTVGDSSGSSPQLSPRPLGNVDDLEHFHDLFYKPDRSNSENTSPMEPRKAVRSAASSDALHLEVGSSQSVRSGLSSLARKLTEEYEDRLSQEYPSELDSRVLMQGQRHGGLRGQRPLNMADDHEFIFSDPSNLQDSPPQAMDTSLPLHLDDAGAGPDDNVPEDIASSRASSVLERRFDEDDTFGLPLRFGTVQAVTTPPAVVYDHRAMGHFSLTADKINIAEDGEEQPGKEATERITSQASLSVPRASADPTRSSYMTSTTEGSRMSGLSDFPEPPPVHQMTPAHMSIIHSYFGGDTPQNQIDNPISSTPEIDRRANYRMTFGGDEDIEHIT